MLYSTAKSAASSSFSCKDTIEKKIETHVIFSFHIGIVIDFHRWIERPI